MKINLRDYQKEAIAELRKNNWRGIYEMATGTGKTFTSIFASIEYLEKEGRIFRIILVPYLHLVSQWKRELNNLGIYNIVECGSTNANWVNDLNEVIGNYNLNFYNDVTVIAVYDTSKTKRFAENIARIKGNQFLIADECHNIGAPGIDLKVYEDVEARLGLSATPARWWDEEGTSKVIDFFQKTVFIYSLEEAIFNEYLSEYRYHPIVVDLTSTEIEEYNDLTRKLSICINSDVVDEQMRLMINLKRQMIINDAIMKEKILLKKIIDEKIDKDTLVYCNYQNLDNVTKEISKLGYKVRKFNYKLRSKDRDIVLEQFENGDIEILTAINCLDEGIDIPSITNAFFISSTSNPRQFIQRRGRILRTQEDKLVANIYDFIVLPESASFDTFVNIARSEMPRFAEFSKYAINSSASRKEIYNILKKYDLENLVYKLPWDAYKENKKRWENGDK